MEVIMMHVILQQLALIRGVCCLIQVGDKIEYIKVIDGSDNLKNTAQVEEDWYDKSDGQLHIFDEKFLTGMRARI